MCNLTEAQTKGLISLCFSEISDLFEKFDIDRHSIDITGRTESMFNAVFIKTLFKHFGNEILDYYIGQKDKFFKCDIPTLSFEKDSLVLGVNKE